MTIRLTIEQIKKAGLEYFEAGLLSVQGPTPECQYRDQSGLPCVIGAVLSDEDVAEVEAYEGKTNTVLALATHGIFEFPSEAEMRQAIHIQRLHDAWVEKRNSGAASTKQFESALKIALST